MTRVGMATLITALRNMTQTEADEYTVGNVTYWTVDQLEDVLDRFREDRFREPLISQNLNDNGVTRYYDYFWTTPNVEEATGGTVVWRVEDSAGSARGTADYTVNYEGRHIRFTADQGGTALYLSYRAYDIERAAAYVWGHKAANVANRFDVSSDNHNLRRSQLREAYMQMANFYRQQAKPRFVRTERVDSRW